MPKKSLPPDPTAAEALVYLYALCNIELTIEEAEREISLHGSLNETLKFIRDDPEAASPLHALATIVLEASYPARKPVKLRRRRIANSDAAGQFFAELLRDQRAEQLFLLCLDEKFRAVKLIELAGGDEEKVTISQQKFSRYKITTPFAVLAHNHLSLLSPPSQADVGATALVCDLLRAKGVCLLDHIIVCRDGFVSLAASNQIFCSAAERETQLAFLGDSPLAKEFAAAVKKLRETRPM